MQTEKFQYTVQQVKMNCCENKTCTHCCKKEIPKDDCIKQLLKAFVSCNPYPSFEMMSHFISPNPTLTSYNENHHGLAKQIYDSAGIDEQVNKSVGKILFNIDPTGEDALMCYAILNHFSPVRQANQKEIRDMFKNIAGDLAAGIGEDSVGEFSDE